MTLAYNYTLGILLTITIFIGGCSSAPSVDYDTFELPESFENDSEESYSDSTTDTTLPDRNSQDSSLPHWVVMLPPNEDPNVISIISSSVKQPFGGIEAQRRSALLRAKSEISKIAKTRIKANQLIESNDIHGAVEENYDMNVQERSLNWLSFEHLNIKEQWIDPASGELFMWVQLLIQK